MENFKFLIPEQIIFRHRNLIINTEISLWADAISVEDGWGIRGNYSRRTENFSTSRLSTKVCNPRPLNSKIGKFNKP